MRVYKTERAANRRVTALIPRGYWPAVVHLADGTYCLSHDPMDIIDDEYNV
jgi:hypothetical protein